MSNTNYENMIEICKKFVDTNTIDFYYLFNIDRNMNLMEINKDIKNKKIRSMFNLEHITSGTIPEEYKEEYIKITNSIPYLTEVFSTRKGRKKYDELLAKSKEITEIDISNLENAIIENATKYNLEHTINALTELITSNNLKGFTRDNKARDNIQELGEEKIKNIVITPYIQNLKNNDKLDIKQIVINYINDMFKKRITPNET